MLDWINELFDQDFIPPETSVIPRGIERALVQLLHDCRSLYESAAKRVELHGSESVANIHEYRELLADLHRGVLVKTLVEIAHADRRWNQPEREVAMIVLRHVWGVEIDESSITKALRNVVKHAQLLKWSELFKPFLEHTFLKHDRAELRSIVLRLANVVAKADGRVCPTELTQLEKLNEDITAVLDGTQLQARPAGSSANQAVQQAAELVHQTGGTDDTAEQEAGEPSEKEKQKLFEQAKQELDALIGMDTIKNDVRQLLDFLQVQSLRKEHDLPAAEISFHAVFEGNPGTGKTTVARIIARLLCGLGILETGHTVETDRSGLVAQFAGQTAPRTNERVDEALGGVLFIDEAYSLVSSRGDDAYGIEAVQSLLKRMEDDRDRFVVVIAGYPEPMKQMLNSNPGLSSRFQKTYRFPDYDAKELLKIFYSLCKKYHYKLPKSTQVKLYKGFEKLIETKNESFGNGRLVRNLFEDSIRHMSTRIVKVTPLTREILTTIEPEDVSFPEEALERETH